VTARRQRLYYINGDFGCGLRPARNEHEARRAALREVGSYSFRYVRRATDADVGHIQAMGGYVPKGDYLVDKAKP
jgi:hypothetical protein